MTIPTQTGADKMKENNKTVTDNLKFFKAQRRLSGQRQGTIDRIGQYVWKNRMTRTWSKALVYSFGTGLFIGGPALLGAPFLAVTIAGMVAFGAMELCVRHYLETGGDIKNNLNSGNIFGGKRVQLTPEEVENERKSKTPSPFQYKDPETGEYRKYVLRRFKRQLPAQEGH